VYAKDCATQPAHYTIGWPQYVNEAPIAQWWRQHTVVTDPIATSVATFAARHAISSRRRRFAVRFSSSLSSVLAGSPPHSLRSTVTPGVSACRNRQPAPHTLQHSASTAVWLPVSRAPQLSQPSLLRPSRWWQRRRHRRHRESSPCFSSVEPPPFPDSTAAPWTWSGLLSWPSCRGHLDLLECGQVQLGRRTMLCRPQVWLGRRTMLC
jgi:hypothetical protein